MTHKFTATIAASFLLASTQAQADTVMASIKPITLIANELLTNVAKVDTLLPDGASPHDFALRPSDRKRLNNTDLLIWVGPEIEPYLEKVIDASNVEQMAMLDEHAEHGEDDHKDHEHEENHHDDHEEHDHEEEHHDAHDADDEHEGHDHAGLHPWLDIEVVEHFAEDLSVELQHHFPAKASQIKENETAFFASLKQFESQAKEQLEPVHQKGFLVFHDAYDGFVNHFDLNQVGYFTVSPELKPGAKHLAELRETLEHSGVSCVFKEPQYRPALIDSITRGFEVHVGELDPLASDVALAQGAYVNFMQGLVDEFTECLAKR
ncbi:MULTISPECIES: zinc ABC transporter substrate-binding protein ZnuA [unclassified Marinobacterium]|uniref:zinc ABC transporter substrate-binding protein ZnuA n=1 Tax=unclassified Marinobacterium TaxID=2644139 RepID=UPI001568E5C5|nr:MULTISPECIES: zinc ABC transporter substrate-binding protein ZnuA [unclassified Marinobacterium]NRP11151.1 High-affinity zinc uptake system protein ZnuA precursor [Marinobacterium sp. xm-g-48]NRP83995.1 High-affinity zinc uptake system protein ZnuA precursor [Marinobacterium sp. xm-d-509]